MRLATPEQIELFVADLVLQSSIRDAVGMIETAQLLTDLCPDKKHTVRELAAAVLESDWVMIDAAKAKLMGRMN